MLHASEGMLHAYLDGALDEVAGSDAQSIRDHVAGCGTCAARLEEAKRAREDANAILGGAVPHVELLPLEELRARAEATAPRTPKRPRRRLSRLGWAASIVLALGAGWMLRGQPAEPIGTLDTLEFDRPVLPAAQSEVVAAEIGEQVSDERDRLVGEAVASAAPEVVTAEPAPAATSRAQNDALGRFGDLAVRPVVAAASPPAEQAVRRETATDLTPRPNLRQMGATVSPLSLAARMDSSGAAAQRRDVEREALDATSGLVALEVPERDSIPRSDVARIRPEEPELLPPPVVTSAMDVASLTRVDFGADDRKPKRGDELSQLVPGLPLIVTEFIDDDVPGLTRFIQALGEGETLEILHVPAGVDPETLPPFDADGRTGVIAPRNGGHVILRAPRSVEELKILLDRLNGIG